MADDNDDAMWEYQDNDEIYKTATASFISPALHEELLRTQLSSADIAEIGPVYAKTLPARHHRSSSNSDRNRRYSATSRMEGIILKSLLESKHDEVDSKTLPRKSIRHLPGKMSFKKQLCSALDILSATTLS